MTSILVVEDDDTMRDSIQTILSLNGYNTQCAKDGIDALVNLKSNNPDLIVCDVNMPNLDGYGLLEQVKQNPETFHIPFIFLTVQSDLLNVRKGMNLGAEDYLIKPFLTEELLTAISAQYKKKVTEKKIYIDKNKKFREDVLSTIPHEFRTPLNGIIGFSDLLKHSANEFTGEEIVEISSIISDSADRMLKTMKCYFNYLDVVSKMNDEAFQVKKLIPISLKKAIEKSLSKLNIDDNRKNDFTLTLREDMLFRINADNAIILFENLIENAFKFSKKGQAVKITSTLLDNSRLQVSIYNEGRGFTDLELHSISEFMQFDRKENEQQGLGLGLITVKRICELYGIDIKITSQKGAFVDIRLTFENKPDTSE